MYNNPINESKEKQSTIIFIEYEKAFHKLTVTAGVCVQGKAFSFLWCCLLLKQMKKTLTLRTRVCACVRVCFDKQCISPSLLFFLPPGQITWAQCLHGSNLSSSFFFFFLLQGGRGKEKVHQTAGGSRVFEAGSFCLHAQPDKPRPSPQSWSLKRELEQVMWNPINEIFFNLLLQEQPEACAALYGTSAPTMTL